MLRALSALAILLVTILHPSALFAADLGPMNGTVTIGSVSDISNFPYPPKVRYQNSSLSGNSTLNIAGTVIVDGTLDLGSFNLNVARSDPTFQGWLALEDLRASTSGGSITASGSSVIGVRRVTSGAVTINIGDSPAEVRVGSLSTSGATRVTLNLQGGTLGLRLPNPYNPNTDINFSSTISGFGTTLNLVKGTLIGSGTNSGRGYVSSDATVNLVGDPSGATENALLKDVVSQLRDHPNTFTVADSAYLKNSAYLKDVVIQSAVNKVGAGAVYLDGSNAVISGSIIVGEGALVLGNMSLLGSGTNPIILAPAADGLRSTIVFTQPGENTRPVILGAGPFEGLTVQNGGHFVNISSGTVTQSGSMTFRTSTTVTSNTGTVLRITGNISGAGDANFGAPLGLKISGGALSTDLQGTVELSGVNFFRFPNRLSVGSGDIGVNGGTLKLLSSQALDGSGLVKLHNGATLDLGGFTLFKNFPNEGVGDHITPQLRITSILSSGSVDARTDIVFGHNKDEYETRDYLESDTYTNATISSVQFLGGARMDRALNLTVPGGGDSRVWGTLNAGSYAFTKLGKGTLDVGTLSLNGGNVTVAEGSLTMQTISNTGTVSYTVNTLATLNMGPTPYVFSSDRNFILNEGSKFKVTGTGASTFANANVQLNISAANIQASTISTVKLFVSGGTSGLTLNPHVQILGLSGTSVVLKNSPLLLSDVVNCSDPLGAALAVSGTLAFDRNAFYTITNTDKLIATFNGTLSSIDKTEAEDLSLASRLRSIGKVFDSLNMGGTLSSEVISAVNQQNNAIAKLGGNGDAKARVLSQMAPGLVADSARSGIARLGALGETIENRVDLVAAVAASSATFSYSSDTVFFDPNNQVPMRISKNEEPREWEAWTSGYTSSANQKAEPAEGIFSGSSTRGIGGALGVERTLGGLRLGLMGATGTMRASGDNAQVNSDSWHLGLYAVLPMEQFVVDSSVLFGLSENDSKRTDFGGFQYQSKFQSQDFRASFGFAIFLLPADSAFETASVFRVSYLRYSQTASNETEASNLGLPTHLDAFSDYQITTKVGQRFRVKLRAKDMEYSADGGVYWQHNLPKDSKAVGANFVGISNTSFTIQGGNRSADDTVLDGGISATFKDKHSVRLGVTSTFSGTTGTSTTGLLSFSTKF